jgi:hypothetical protein
VAILKQAVSLISDAYLLDVNMNATFPGYRAPHQSRGDSSWSIRIKKVPMTPFTVPDQSCYSPASLRSCSVQRPSLRHRPLPLRRLAGHDIPGDGRVTTDFASTQRRGPSGGHAEGRQNRSRRNLLRSRGVPLTSPWHATTLTVGRRDIGWGGQSGHGRRGRQRRRHWIGNPAE